MGKLSGKNYVYNNVIRCFLFLIAGLISLVSVYGQEILRFELKASFSFLIGVFIFSIPLLLVTDIICRMHRISFAVWMTAQTQLIFVVLLIFKYLLGDSMISVFTYNASKLYIQFAAIFLLLSIVQKIVMLRGDTENKSGFTESLKDIIPVQILFLVVLLAAFAHRKKAFLPSFELSWLAVQEKVIDSQQAYGTEALSQAITPDNPILIFDPPNDQIEFCILTRDGKVVAVKESNGTFETHTLINLSEKLGVLDGELGTQGAVFGPRLVDTPQGQYRPFFLYAAYRMDDQIVNRLSSFEMDEENWVITPSSEKILIEQDDPTAMHNGGGLLFGPDGYLYLGLGDGGPESDGSALTQKIGPRFFSGILRLDVYGLDPEKVKPIEQQPTHGKTKGYWIPRTNPFVGVPNALEEYWAIGLRNPFRFTFDTDGKKIIVGDVGQSFYEEINIIRGGDNGGWSFREGPLSFQLSYLKGNPPSNLHGNLVSPVYWYRNSQHQRCIIAGFIYEGAQFPEFADQFLFGDFNSGELKALEIGSKEQTMPVRFIGSESHGLGRIPFLTSLYPYKGDILASRLGKGDQGKTILRIKHASELSQKLQNEQIQTSPMEQYELLCSRCHGLNGNPLTLNSEIQNVAARDFTNKTWQSETSDAQIKQAIRDGIQTDAGIVMPAWGELLSEAEIDALVKWVRQFGD